jgi:hypothetical protein
MRTPPLAINGSTPPSVLFGAERLNDSVRGGVRTTIGTWLGDGCNFGLQGSYFFLGPDHSFRSAGSPILGAVNRPFINANGQTAFQLVPGTVVASASTTGLMGADALLRCKLCCEGTACGGYRLDMLGGYRYFALNDQLTIRENLLPPAPFVTGTQIVVVDSFATRNRFNGGSIGGELVGWRGPFRAGLTARLDLGSMEREVQINGATQVTVPGTSPLLRTGGLLAQTTNIGTFRSSSFTLIPEFDFRIGCRLTNWLSVSAGYSFILLTDVARAGDQIDLRVNPNVLPGAPMTPINPTHPAFALRTTNTWVQGLTLGLTFEW